MGNKLKVGIVIQARCSSERLPNKVLKKIPVGSKTSVLEQIIRIASLSRLTDSVIVATSTDDCDKPITLVEGCECYAGSRDNVLERFYKTSLRFQLDVIVRLTADNPCIDIKYIDQATEKLIASNLDYVRTIGLPVGMNAEVMSFAALESAYEQATETYDLEHVTAFFYRNRDKYRIEELNTDIPPHMKDVRLTMDYPSDYALLNIVHGALAEQANDFDSVSDFFLANNWLKLINPNNQRTLAADLEEEIKDAKNLLQITGYHRVSELLDSSQ